MHCSMGYRMDGTGSPRMNGAMIERVVSELLELGVTLEEIAMVSVMVRSVFGHRRGVRVCFCVLSPPKGDYPDVSSLSYSTDARESFRDSVDSRKEKCWSGQYFD